MRYLVASKCWVGYGVVSLLRSATQSSVTQHYFPKRRSTYTPACVIGATPLGPECVLCVFGVLGDEGGGGGGGGARSQRKKGEGLSRVAVAYIERVSFLFVSVFRAPYAMIGREREERRGEERTQQASSTWLDESSWNK